jgi:O-succinylbenzoate synthase
MKIDRITLTHVRIPLVEPFRISNGEIGSKDGIVVGVHSDGVVGHGEASPMAGSFYSEDTPESVWEHLVADLLPAVVKESPSTVDEVNAVLDKIPGSPFARAGIETAWWDLEGQKSGRPLHKMLGGTRNRLESGLAVGIYPTLKELRAAVERYMREGYKRIKIKIQPGWDVEPLEMIRKYFSGIPLMVDANCAYRRENIDHLVDLDDFEMMMIEQPLPKDDLEGHALLQSKNKTPVCLDEGAEDISAVRRAIELRACKIVNIKVQRVGGLKKAKEIHDLCAQAGIPVWAGTMPELGIGGVQTLHLATLGNFIYPTDVESSRRWFVDDIVDPLITVDRGVITIPEGNGNGYRLNEKVVQKYKVRELSVPPL